MEDKRFDADQNYDYAIRCGVRNNHFDIVRAILSFVQKTEISDAKMFKIWQKCDY